MNFQKPDYIVYIALEISPLPSNFEYRNKGTVKTMFNGVLKANFQGGEAMIRK